MKNTPRSRADLLAPEAPAPGCEAEPEPDSIDVIVESDEHEQPTDAPLVTTEPDALEGQVVSVRPSDLGIAEHLAEKFLNDGPAVVFSEGAFFNWTGSHWARSTKREMYAWLRPYDQMRSGPNGVVSLSRGRMESIFHVLATLLEVDGFFDGRSVGINAANGFVDISSGRPRLVAHDLNQRQEFVLRGRWAEDGVVDDELLRRLMTGSFGEDRDGMRKAIALMELAGAVAAGIGPKLRDPVAFVLVGEGANGKSQVLEALQGLVPADAVSAIPITDFSHDRYRVQLAGKRLNVCAELGSGRDVASDVFKSIISGDLISAREILRAVTKFRPRAMHVFATNELPSFDRGMPHSISRRLLVVPFTRIIPKEEREPNLGHRIAQSEMDALVTYAVRGAVRLHRRGRFTVPPSSGTALREWVEEADVIAAFLADGWVRSAPGERVPTREAYSHFRVWAHAQGTSKVPAMREFVRRLVSAGMGFEKQRSAKLRTIANIALACPGLA